ADIIAAAQAGGHIAIQIFFFRADRNYGSRLFYPSHDKQLPLGEILSAFLAQFYADKPAPSSIFLSDPTEDTEVLMQALSEQAGHNVKIAVPKLGDKKRLIDHARKNAQDALARKMSESSEQAKLLARVAETFGLPEAPKRIE